MIFASQDVIHPRLALLGAADPAMNIDRDIDLTSRVVILTLSGELSDEGLMELGNVIETIPGIRRDFSLLIDVRFSDGKKITSEGVRLMAAQPLVLSPESRRAIVVASMLGYGMARMYGLLRGLGGTRVFRDYDKARRWVETGT